MAQHKVELKAIVLDSSRGTLSQDLWRLENVTGKCAAVGDDTLSYRLVFADPYGWPLNNTLIIKVWPALYALGRRNGAPEAGLMVAPIPPERAHNQAFYGTPAYSVVFKHGGGGIEAIYFALENHNFEPSGPPLWRLAVDASAVLANLPCIHGRWIPLPPIHPDPSVDPGVPIEQCHQGTPRWSHFRQQCSNYDVFKGKLSGSVMFKFLGGGFKPTAFFDDREFKGNNLTRHGNATESKIVLAHLLRFAEYSGRECGSYQHPTIADACGAPDAILYHASRTFDTLPGWLQKLWEKQEDESWKQHDWRFGVFEAKAMKQLDKHRRGPEIKPEHICQVYWNMICTGTCWGELARCCDETGKGRVYRIYRRPDTSQRLEACVRRMHREMIAGTPYATAMQSEQNVELVTEFKTQAAYYNDDHEVKHYYELPWPVPEAAELEKKLASYDICFNEQAPIPSLEPALKKRQTKNGKKKDSGDETTTMTAAAVFPVMNVDAAYMTDGACLKAYETTNEALGLAIRNGDYHVPLAENIFELQVLRLMQMKARAHAALAVQGAMQDDGG